MAIEREDLVDAFAIALIASGQIKVTGLGAAEAKGHQLYDLANAMVTGFLNQEIDEEDEVAKPNKEDFIQINNGSNTDAKSSS